MYSCIFHKCYIRRNVSLYGVRQKQLRAPTATVEQLSKKPRYMLAGNFKCFDCASLVANEGLHHTSVARKEVVDQSSKTINVVRSRGISIYRADLAGKFFQL